MTLLSSAVEPHKIREILRIKGVRHTQNNKNFNFFFLETLFCKVQFF